METESEESDEAPEEIPLPQPEEEQVIPYTAPERRRRTSAIRPKPYNVVRKHTKDEPTTGNGYPITVPYKYYKLPHFSLNNKLNFTKHSLPSYY